MTGFQSLAQDHIEHVIDLTRLLDLQKPGIYPVRVSGQAFAERGIRDGDDTAAFVINFEICLSSSSGSLTIENASISSGSIQECWKPFR